VKSQSFYDALQRGEIGAAHDLHEQLVFDQLLRVGGDGITDACTLRQLLERTPLAVADVAVRIGDEVAGDQKRQLE
jgi:hypothetical protein